MRVLLVIPIFISLSAYSAPKTPRSCADLLSSRFYQEVEAPGEVSGDGTAGFTGYLGELLEQQIIGDLELIRLIEGLEQGELRNPIAFEDREISSSKLIHYDGLQDYIRQTSLNREEVLVWSQQNLKEKERVRERRSVVKTETEDIHQKMEFHSLPEGSFEMGEGGKKVSVTLTHPFEMTSTAITQKQWVEVMGENPSRFSEGEHTIQVNQNGKSIKMQPDNPVEKVTWWSVVEFANRLSEKAGLKPAYDLSGINFSGRAEDGTLKAEGGDLKINAPGGDIYKAEGYRVPTEAEWEYVVRALGQANGKYHFGDSESDLEEHGWFDKNAGNTTHPVAELKPLIIDGKAFYDLHGNVWEWTHDWYDEKLSGGDDPQGPKGGSVRVIRGGGWNYDASFLRSANRFYGGPGHRYDDVGFRLVRTLP